MSGPIIHVLDPTAVPAQTLEPPAPALTSLEQRVLGLRVDRTWRSFVQFADIIRREAPHRWGVRDVVVFDPGTRIGTTEEERHKVAGFVRAVDAAIVGLGT
jgi:hypothetical protein